MSQNDFVIANDTAANVRQDMNDAFQALVSLSSGSTAPSTTYANMLWYDTGNNILKMRTEADDAWIDIGTLNQSTNEFEVANLTELTQAQVEDDTDTTFGLVSGDRLNQSIKSNLNVTGSAPMYACRAWVNFDGTGTVSIRASGNVSSITDNGTGQYTVNFTTAMEDADYVVTTSVQAGSGTDNANVLQISGNLSTTSLNLLSEYTKNGFAYDAALNCVAVFR